MTAPILQKNLLLATELVVTERRVEEHIWVSMHPMQVQSQEQGRKQKQKPKLYY